MAQSVDQPLEFKAIWGRLILAIAAAAEELG
jgi:hypothetical protein